MGEVLCTHSECRCQNKATRRSVGGATTVRPPRAAVNKAAVFIARGFYRWHPITAAEGDEREVDWPALPSSGATSTPTAAFHHLVGAQSARLTGPSRSAATIQLGKSASECQPALCNAIADIPPPRMSGKLAHFESGDSTSDSGDRWRSTTRRQRRRKRRKSGTLPDCDPQLVICTDLSSTEGRDM